MLARLTSCEFDFFQAVAALCGSAIAFFGVRVLANGTFPRCFDFFAGFPSSVERTLI